MPNYSITQDLSHSCIENVKTMGVKVHVRYFVYICCFVFYL
jgi:hypothetical protein